MEDHFNNVPSSNSYNLFYKLSIFDYYRLGTPGLNATLQSEKKTRKHNMQYQAKGLTLASSGFSLFHKYSENRHTHVKFLTSCVPYALTNKTQLSRDVYIILCYYLATNPVLTFQAPSYSAPVSSAKWSAAYSPC